MAHEQQPDNLKRRSITVGHDKSQESREAIDALKSREGEEDMVFVDTTEYDWSEPHNNEVPFAVTPEGTLEGLEGIKKCTDRPDEFRR